MSYLIYMDVSGDVASDVAQQGQLRFVPMEYSVGGDMRHLEAIESRDTLHMFYEGQRHGDLTQTSQISPYLYETCFEPAMREGHSILYLSLSSGLSSTYQSALLAKQTLEERYPGQFLCPIDSLAATGGMGVLVERAMRNAQNGLSLEDNVADIQNATTRIRHWFMVQDLMYLKRGGRIGAAAAVIGTALSVHPILKIDEVGKLVITEKKRGNKLALQALLDHFCADYDNNSQDVVYVIDADAPESAARLEEGILQAFPHAIVRRSGLSPIIGAHTGPGMAAICYLARP